MLVEPRSSLAPRNAGLVRCTNIALVVVRFYLNDMIKVCKHQTNQEAARTAEHVRCLILDEADNCTCMCLVQTTSGIWSWMRLTRCSPWGCSPNSNASAPWSFPGNRKQIRRALEFWSSPKQSRNGPRSALHSLFPAGGCFHPGLTISAQEHRHKEVSLWLCKASAVVPAAIPQALLHAVQKRAQLLLLLLL